METIEWGVRRSWPDGHVEVDAMNCRAVAEATIRATNRMSENEASAELVRRVLPDWEPVKSAADEVAETDWLTAPGR